MTLFIFDTTFEGSVGSCVQCFAEEKPGRNTRHQPFNIRGIRDWRRTLKSAWTENKPVNQNGYNRLNQHPDYAEIRSYKPLAEVCNRQIPDYFPLFKNLLYKRKDIIHNPVPFFQNLNVSLNPPHFWSFSEIISSIPSSIGHSIPISLSFQKRPPSSPG